MHGIVVVAAFVDLFALSSSGKICRKPTTGEYKWCAQRLQKTLI